MISCFHVLMTSSVTNMHMANIEKIKKLAHIIVDYSIDLKKGEKVLLVGYGFDSYPLIKEIYRECVKHGAKKIEVKFPRAELSRLFYENASDAQLKYLDPLDKKTADNYDAMIQIVAEDNPYEMTHIDRKKINMSSKARKPISDILHKKKWCLFYYPNLASAQKAKKNLEEWQEFVWDSCLVDWKKEEKRQQKFVNIMKKVKDIRITGKETDLTLSVKGQNWRKCCGTHNLPDGEIFTSPLLKSVNGHIRYNVPTHYHSHDFDWIKLHFKDGKIVDEESNNPEKLTEILNTDKGARYVGEFAFGLNHNIKEGTRQIIFDEKMGKSLHMAMGKCYDECPNGNDSQIHWDMIFNFKWAGAEVFFDGKKVFSKTKWIDPKLKFLN